MKKLNSYFIIIISRYPEVQNILKAITKPWKKLSITLVLFCIVTYFFALVAYFQYWIDFDP